MWWFRHKVSRRLLRYWRDHVWLDLPGALLGAVVLAPVPRDVDSVRALLSAVAGIEAMLVALVTFALTFIYQSQAPELKKVRRNNGVQLRRSWQWCLSVVMLATLATLGGIWMAPVSAAWSCGVGVGAFGLAVMSTVRALDFFSYAVQAESLSAA